MYKEDSGIDFGTWSDPVSRLIYFDAMPYLLSIVDTNKSAADLGGANGILKKFFSDIITVDIDGSKKPDVICDILNYKGVHNTLVLRYVMHYLTDTQVVALMENISLFHKGEVLVIQFVNEENSIDIKNANSKNEGKKFFRTESELKKLIKFGLLREKRISYECDSEFYLNRLGIKNAQTHSETILSLIYKVAQ